MNIDSLQIFVDVAHQLSFAAVADRHNVDPSSISRTISALEADLGGRLFHRTTRQMTLTETGEMFLAKATRILAMVSETKDQLNTTAPSGTLRLATSIAFGERVLIPKIPEFRAAYPDIKLELLMSDTNQNLVAESIDLAIRLGAELHGDIIISKLKNTRYRVCASQAYLDTAPPLDTPEQLTDHQCLLLTMATFRDNWQFRSKSGKSSIVPIKGDVAISSALSLRTAAIDGGGPALLPDWLVDADIGKGALIDIFPNYNVTATSFETAIWMVYPSREYVPRKVHVMMDFLRNSIT